MTFVFNRPKWLWYFLLVGLVLSANTALYHLPIYESVPTGAVWGSMFDLFIVIPLLTYLFILRKRHSLKYLGIVFLVCYFFANLIIPSHHMMFPYIIVAFEALFITIELILLYRFIVKLPQIMMSFNVYEHIPYFHARTIKAISRHLPVNRMTKILVSDMSIFYYALFSWKKKPPVAKDKFFTYHKNSSVMMIYIMLIHATVIETIGLHVLVHQWSAVLAWILLALNVYAVLFFIAEIRAIGLSPFMIDHGILYLQVGLTKSAVIPFKDIDQIRTYEGPAKLSKKVLKITMVATVKDIFHEKPSYEIILREKVEVNYMYGFRKSVDRVLLNVDDYEAFRSALLAQDY